MYSYQIILFKPVTGIRDQFFPSCLTLDCEQSLRIAMQARKSSEANKEKRPAEAISLPTLWSCQALTQLTETDCLQSNLTCQEIICVHALKVY